MINWTSNQNSAISALSNHDKNILIDSVAGSGKSTVLKESIVRAIERGQYKNILVLAFNTVIREELNRWVKEAKLGDLVTVHTYHSFGLSLIRNVGRARVSYSKYRTFIEERVKDRDVVQLMLFLINKIRSSHMFEYSYTELLETVEKSSKYFSRKMGAKRYSAAYTKIQNNLELVIRMSEELDAYCDEVTLQDMIRIPVTQNLTRFCNYDLVCVDEIQDTDPTQKRIIYKLHEERKSRMYLIGDTYQAIYAFRGAELDVIEDIQDRLKCESSIILEETQRCNVDIVELVREEVVMSRAFKSDKITDEGGIAKVNAYYMDRENMITMAVKSATMVYAGHQEKIDAIITARNSTLTGIWADLIVNYGINARFKDLDIIKSAVEVLQQNEHLGLVMILETELSMKIHEHYDEFSSFTLDSDLLDKYESVILLMKLIRAFTIADLVKKIQDMLAQCKTSSLLLSTVHRSKGLGFRGTLVVGDWFNGAQLENMKYVALTRGMLFTAYVKLHKLAEDSIPDDGIVQVNPEEIRSMIELSDIYYRAGRL